MRKRNVGSLSLKDHIYIYINEHLSMENRRIFEEASVKRKALNYKHMVIKRKVITYMRKGDGTPIFTIDGNEALNKLD